MKHNIDQQDSSTGAAGLFSVYRYLLSVCNEEDSRNHTMLPLKFLEHEGWTFGVFARWGEIQTGFGGMDMHQVGDAMDFLAQVSEGLAYLNSLGIAHTLIHEDSFVRNILGAEQFHPNWSAYRAFEPEPLPIKYGIVLHSLARFVDPNVVPDSHEDISDLNESGNVTSAMSKLSSPHVTTGTTRDTYKHENKLKAFVRQAFKGKTKGHTSVNPYLARDVYQFGELIRASLLPLLSHVPELDPLTQHMTSRRREDRPTMVEVHQHLADIQNLLDEEVKQRECPMEFVGKWPPVTRGLASQGL
ncbi:hypothetical protein K474DRAFT_72606 [Panus rudis PR-1116 ss-1]|nr:hypothetical protein K474DRAFT_72606 [Panus rudis PR-1116 ss-1]